MSLCETHSIKKADVVLGIAKMACSVELTIKLQFQMKVVLQCNWDTRMRWKFEFLWLYLTFFIPFYVTLTRTPVLGMVSIDSEDIAIFSIFSLWIKVQTSFDRNTVKDTDNEN